MRHDGCAVRCWMTGRLVSEICHIPVSTRPFCCIRTIGRSAVTARTRSVADAKGRPAGLSNLRWKQVQLQLENDLGAGTIRPVRRCRPSRNWPSGSASTAIPFAGRSKQLCKKRLLRVKQGRGTFVPERDLAYRVGPKSRLTAAAELSDRRAAWQRLCKRHPFPPTGS